MIGRLRELLTPQMVWLEPTNDCQLHCITCYRVGRKVGYMSEETFSNFRNNIPINVRAIALNGAGDPLLHPRFIEMVDSLAGWRYKLSFSTNGLLLNSDMQDAIIDKIDWINISIDGTAEDYDMRRPGGNWDILKQNADSLIGKKRKRTKISVSLTRYNHSDDEVSTFKQAWRKADKVAIGEWHSSALQTGTPQTGKCDSLANQKACMILWNGDVTTCCWDLRGGNVCGNINESKFGKIKRVSGPLCKTCVFG